MSLKKNNVHSYERTMFRLGGGRLKVSQSAASLGDALDQEMDFFLSSGKSYLSAPAVIVIERKD